MAILIKNRTDRDVEITPDTLLFRITSLAYTSKQRLLAGQGGISMPGRYNSKGEATTYASDDPALCIAEGLYHLSRRGMWIISKNKNPSDLKAWRREVNILKTLVIFKVKAVSDLVYVDTEQCFRDAAYLRKNLSSTLLVNPDCFYRPLQQISTHYRNLKPQKINGLIYPSARYPGPGYGIALFGNMKLALQSIVARVQITLALVDESNPGQHASYIAFNPYKQAISYVQGYYEIKRSDFHTHQKHFPTGFARNGNLNFVRFI